MKVLWLCLITILNISTKENRLPHMRPQPVKCDGAAGPHPTLAKPVGCGPAAPFIRNQAGVV